MSVLLDAKERGVKVDAGTSFIRRHKTIVIPASGLLLLIIVGISIGIVQLKHAQKAASAPGAGFQASNSG
jgi:hypothetical protein